MKSKSNPTKAKILPYLNERRVVLDHKKPRDQFWSFLNEDLVLNIDTSNEEICMINTQGVLIQKTDLRDLIDQLGEFIQVDYSGTVFLFRSDNQISVVKYELVSM